MSTTNDKIIIPTIGRRVWFRPDPRAGATGFVCHDEKVPMDAGIVYVWSDSMVNLDVCDHGGNHHKFTSVPLVHTPFDAPPQGHYCEWMPFQKGQAKAPLVTPSTPDGTRPSWQIKADGTLIVEAGNLYRKRPIVVKVITFEQLVQHGIDEGAALTSGMPWCFTYGGHAISHENDDCYLIPTKEGTMKMGRGDVLITGVQGEIYPCKRDIFEATYEPATPTAPELSASQIDGRGLLSFGIALDLLKNGAKVARTGWNGKGMFVYLVPAASYPVQTGAAASHFGKGVKVPYNAYMALKTVEGPISTWVPSVSDCLADDWVVVE